MNATHAPTPWTADDGAVWYGDRPIRVLIADCSPAGGNDHAIGDAAFIVRACNAHDELVAALKDAHRALGGAHIEGLPSRIRAALAKAGAA